MAVPLYPDPERVRFAFSCLSRGNALLIEPDYGKDQDETEWDKIELEEIPSQASLEAQNVKCVKQGAVELKSDCSFVPLLPSLSTGYQVFNLVSRIASVTFNGSLFVIEKGVFPSYKLFQMSGILGGLACSSASTALKATGCLSTTAAIGLYTLNGVGSAAGKCGSAILAGIGGQTSIQTRRRNALILNIVSQGVVMGALILKRDKFGQYLIKFAVFGTKRALDYLQLKVS